ncbi:hypothetical protein EZV62_001727 [Acer yangbiense]|uniref:Plastid lipid-associated protein/fibrillin conserved domain-containing protein n=1 Tax=Acer yangbiense TaxID=1000413 RepID=A0A5C7IVP5_9ROSI|nr:hypothetical protein EZV62_001727 [Acer yangbiense]
MAVTFHATNTSLHLNAHPPFSSRKSLPCSSSKLFKSSPKRKTCVVVIRSSVVQEQDISFTDEENQLVDALIGIQGRGRSASPQQLNDVEQAVKVLEGLQGIPDPTDSSLIEGRWQLMFTTRPGTASPIQRTFVGVDFFSVFQEISLRTNDPRVSNIVKFSDAIGELKVEAAASIKDGKRILFRFDRAAFSLKFLPFKVPYPVPFRLLGDEAKGWLDTTYLSPSGNLRISRGNKGTTFVLQKKTEPRQRLLSAISTGTGVAKAVDEFISLNRKIGKDEPELLEGEWQMIWSSQVETDSWLENAGNGLMGKQARYNDILFVHLLFNGKMRETDSNPHLMVLNQSAIFGAPSKLPILATIKRCLPNSHVHRKLSIINLYKKHKFINQKLNNQKYKGKNRKPPPWR